MSYQIPRMGLNQESQRRISALQQKIAEDQVEMLRRQGEARTKGIEGTYGKIGEGITAAVEGYAKGEDRANAARKQKMAEDEYAAMEPVRTAQINEAKYLTTPDPVTGLTGAQKKRIAEDEANATQLAYVKSQTDKNNRGPEPDKETWTATANVDKNGNVILVSNRGNTKSGPQVGTKPGAEDDALPFETKKQLDAIATKNAGMRVSGNTIKSGLAAFQSAQTDDEKIRIGRGMLKELNSLVSADAIGVEEAKRLGDALEYQILNLTGPGKLHGRDLGGFETQVKATIGKVENAIKMNENELDKLRGRAPRNVVAQPRLENKAPAESGTAIAAPTGKPRQVIQNGVTYTLNPETGQYE